MFREIEAKYRLDDPEDLRRRLALLGAKPGPLARETNRLFDSAGDALRSAGCGLRVRTAEYDDGSVATLTFKGPRQPGPLKIREEIETAVAEADRLRLILERLGLRPIVVYEKRRQTWTLDRCEICIDELPVLGWFCEIEGPDENAVNAAAKRLALDPLKQTSDAYPALAVRQGKMSPDGCPALLFDAPPKT